MNKELVRIPGYDLIDIQPSVCGSRPTLIGHRLEPRHFDGMSTDEILDGWSYLKMEQIKEMQQFIVKFPETLDPDRDVFPCLEQKIAGRSS